MNCKISRQIQALEPDFWFYGNRIFGLGFFYSVLDDIFHGNNNYRIARTVPWGYWGVSSAIISHWCSSSDSFIHNAWRVVVVFPIEWIVRFFFAATGLLTAYLFYASIFIAAAAEHWTEYQMKNSHFEKIINQHAFAVSVLNRLHAAIIVIEFCVTSLGCEQFTW